MESMQDHIELGKALDLFIQSPIVGKGLPLLTPRGAAIRRELIRFVEDEEIRRGYDYTATPFMADEELYKISGHWDLYRDIMFLLPVNDEGARYLALRPMTCPFQFQLYKRKTRSYRDLPVRYGETSYLFRNEPSGALRGLIRTRQFTLSEGHIICRPDQIEEEFLEALSLVRFVADKIGLTGIWYRFSKRGSAAGGKFIDDPEAWKSSEERLKLILDKTGEKYVEADGEAAFYGPKLDIQARDTWGREETLFTLQLDFALPARFGMTYLDEDGRERFPMVIHRSSIGCYERTIALLLEQYQGRLPFWMAPEHARVLTVGAASSGYGARIVAAMRERGLRAGIDARQETLGKKIQGARAMLVPAMLVVGGKEESEGTVGFRLLSGDSTRSIKLEAFIELCDKMRRERTFDFD
jgi:threonyl-tRNA synthetase